MAHKKLKDFRNTGEFHIIDEWTHQTVETLPAKEAIEKYGECEVWSSYTSGNSQLPDSDGKTPSWKTDVWIWIPGMHCGISNDGPFTIPGEVVEEDGMPAITFVGKKSGLLITVYEMGRDDYCAWWREESERNMEHRGYSTRGTAKQVYEELKGEI